MSIIRDASAYRTLQTNLEYNSTKLNEYYVKASTGIELEKASDDPSSVRQIINFRSSITESDRYIESASSVQDSLSSGEVYVDSVLDIMDRAREMAVAAANDSLSDEDFETYRLELAEMEEALLDYANAQVENKYIFAGYSNDQQPFSGDPVVYSGTSDHQMIEVSPGTRIEKNITGEELFMNPVDLFATLDDLDAALQSGDVSLISGQLEPLENAAEQVRTVQGRLGINSARLDDLMTAQINYKLQMQEQLSAKEDADLTEVLSEISKMELSLEATMQVTGRVSSLNLFNYL